MAGRDKRKSIVAGWGSEESKGLSLEASEWRTSPLWGIGLVEDFQGGQAFFLHDGRARSLWDAIGFHGGEGAASRAAFDRFSEAEQAQLIAFLKSL